MTLELQYIDYWMTKDILEQTTFLHFGDIIRRGVYYSLVKINVNGG